jgi:K+-transporting ATPase ATPase A chain
LGRYLHRVFAGERTFLDAVLVPVERFVPAIDGRRSVGAAGLEAVFDLAACLEPRDVADDSSRSFCFSTACRSIRRHRGDGGRRWRFNTISSFTTNTNLQHYSGETGLSYFSQLFVIVFLQFVTAATGMCGVGGHHARTGGKPSRVAREFLRRLTRAAVRVLLPLSLFIATNPDVAGPPMTFRRRSEGHDVEGRSRRSPRGVVAPMVAIKQLGTNGGGYFGPKLRASVREPDADGRTSSRAGRSRSFPMAMVWTLWPTYLRRRLAVRLRSVMLALYLPMVVFASAKRWRQPGDHVDAVDQSTGSMEGKEVRFGAGLSALWAVTTTVTSNGSVNAMHDSMTPLGGLMPFVGMWLNNIFGGVGVGFINMLIFSSSPCSSPA